MFQNWKFWTKIFWLFVWFFPYYFFKKDSENCILTQIWSLFILIFQFLHSPLDLQSPILKSPSANLTSSRAEQEFDVRELLDKFMTKNSAIGKIYLTDLAVDSVTGIVYLSFVSKSVMKLFQPELLRLKNHHVYFRNKLSNGSNQKWHQIIF